MKEHAGYDCIIPVTADSYYIVDSVKNGLGLNPLW